MARPVLAEKAQENCTQSGQIIFEHKNTAALCKSQNSIKTGKNSQFFP